MCLGDNQPNCGNSRQVTQQRGTEAGGEDVGRAEA